MVAWLLSQFWHVKSYLCMGWSRRTIAPHKKLPHSSTQFHSPCITKVCKISLSVTSELSQGIHCFLKVLKYTLPKLPFLDTLKFFLSLSCPDLRSAKGNIWPIIKESVESGSGQENLKCSKIYEMKQ